MCYCCYLCTNTVKLLPLAFSTEITRNYMAFIPMQFSNINVMISHKYSNRVHIRFVVCDAQKLRSFLCEFIEDDARAKCEDYVWIVLHILILLGPQNLFLTVRSSTPSKCCQLWYQYNHCKSNSNFIILVIVISQARVGYHCYYTTEPEVEC